MSRDNRCAALRASRENVSMRVNAEPNDVLRALGKAIEATFARGDWLDLALLTDTEQVVTRHRRLLRSLEWNDPDYSGNVLEVLPTVLGDRGPGPRQGVAAADRFPNLRIVEDRVGLQQWLANNDPTLHEALYGGEDKSSLTTFKRHRNGSDFRTSGCMPRGYVAASTWIPHRQSAPRRNCSRRR